MVFMYFLFLSVGLPFNCIYTSDPNFIRQCFKLTSTYYVFLSVGLPFNGIYTIPCCVWEEDHHFRS